MGQLLPEPMPQEREQCAQACAHLWYAFDETAYRNGVVTAIRHVRQCRMCGIIQHDNEKCPTP